MNQVLGQLVHLQELEFVQSDQLEMGDASSVVEIEREIESILSGLSGQIANMYRDLLERTGVAVVAERRGHCSACGLAIPTLQLTEIRRSNGIQRCQSCRRVLYHMEDAPRRNSAFAPANGSRGFARYSSLELMCPGMVSETRVQALSELIAPMVDQGWITNRAKVLAYAVEREIQASTAMDHQLAFPHVRGLETGGLKLSVGTTRKGISFATEPSKIVVFAIIPTAGNTVWLRLLSELIDILKEEQQRIRLLECETPRELWSTLRQIMDRRSE